MGDAAWEASVQASLSIQMWDGRLAGVAIDIGLACLVIHNSLLSKSYIRNAELIEVVVVIPIISEVDWRRVALDLGEKGNVAVCVTVKSFITFLSVI